MPDSVSTGAERALQRGFSKSLILQSLLLFAAVVAAHRLFADLPNRQELGPAAVELRFEPLDLGLAGFGPFRLAGAWTITADDPRWTGVSAVAVDGRSVIALTDAGVAVRLPKPGRGRTTALIDELPAGPGDRSYKRNRDSEALVRDPSGRGWWVSFEYRNEIWLYDTGLNIPLKRIRIRRSGWGRNAGLEALAADGSDLLLLPEATAEILRIDREGRLRKQSIRGLTGRVSDAVALRGGGLLLVERSVTPIGFSNALVRVDEADGAYRVTGRAGLPLGPLYNVEGLALEPLPDGRLRLWLVTDDGHEPRPGTVLLALDVAAPATAQAP